METKILGRTIQIRFVNDRELSALAEDTDVLGLYTEGKISLSSSMDEERAKSVLMHEVAHAVLGLSGLSQLLDKNMEEAICTAFETYIDVIRSPDVVNYINSKEEE